MSELLAGEIIGLSKMIALGMLKGKTYILCAPIYIKFYFKKQFIVVKGRLTFTS